MARAGMDAWQGPRESTRTLEGGHVVSGEASSWWAHGLVGHGKIIGAVTQMRNGPLPFICANLFLFLRVELCPV